MYVFIFQAFFCIYIIYQISVLVLFLSPADLAFSFCLLVNTIDIFCF